MYKQFTAYQLSNNLINLSFHKDQEEFDLKYLQEDNLEEILYIKNEELAVNLPWINSIVLNFWQVDEIYDIFDMASCLFENKTIKNLQDVTFKYFKKLPQEILIFMFKLKIIKSEENYLYHIELLYDQQYEVRFSFVEQSKNFQFLKYYSYLQRYKYYNIRNIDQQLKVIQDILSREYSNIYVYFESNIKFQTNTDDEGDDILEVFIHQDWFDLTEVDLLANFDRLHSYMLQNRTETSFDLALLLSEQQANDNNLVVSLNQIVIEFLLKNNASIKNLKLSIMPFEIHFDYTVNSKALLVDINVQYDDKVDMVQDGVIILLNALVQCRQINELVVTLQCKEYTHNRQFQLFRFIMAIYDFTRLIPKVGRLYYNDVQMIPKKETLSLEGAFQFLISDQKQIYISNRAMYLITAKGCLDIQKEMLSFLRYVNLYTDVQILILSCSFQCLDQSGKRFITEFLEQILKLQYLGQFSLLDKDGSQAEYPVVDKIRQNIFTILKAKQRLVKQLDILKKAYHSRFRVEVIHEIVGYLPLNYL